MRHIGEYRKCWTCPLEKGGPSLALPRIENAGPVPGKSPDRHPRILTITSFESSRCCLSGEGIAWGGLRVRQRLRLADELPHGVEEPPSARVFAPGRGGVVGIKDTIE